MIILSFWQRIQYLYLRWFKYRQLFSSYYATPEMVVFHLRFPIGLVIDGENERYRKKLLRNIVRNIPNSSMIVETWVAGLDLIDRFGQGYSYRYSSSNITEEERMRLAWAGEVVEVARIVGENEIAESIQLMASLR